MVDKKRKRILALWAHPRARSTAVCRMMCERGDFCIKDEPFGSYYYFSDERISRRRTDVEPNAGYRFDAVFKGVLQEAEGQQIFIKDHAYHVISRADPAFLSHFQNTFLIRHPAQSIPSLYAMMPDFTLQETGYEESFRLFELVRAMEGTAPAVIDADDLVENPEPAVRAYCEAVGIPFLRRSLNWKSGLPSDLNADWGGWYSHLEKSNGFARQSNPDYVAVGDNATTLRAYEHSLSYYQRLHQHRLHIPHQA